MTDSFGWLSRVRAPVLVSYAAFVFIGVYAGTGGVLLLSQMNGYGVDRATIGITFFTGSAGYVFAGLSNGALMQRFGIRMALAVGGGAFMLAGLYMATRPPFAAFVAVQLVIGYGTGVLESVLNTYIASLPGATALLNRLHAFFGVGALVGPVLAAWIVSFAPWTLVWLVLTVACVPLTAGFLIAHPGPAPTWPAIAAEPGTPAAEPGTQPADTGTRPAEEPGSPAGRLLAAALRDPGVLCGTAMLAVYVGLEIGVGNWGFSYLVQGRGLTGTLAGYAVSGYWLGLTAGRFLINPVAARAGLTTVRMMYVCLAGIIAAATLAWLAPTAGTSSAALVLLGFFLGPVFPTMMAITPRLTTPRLVPTAIGILNAGGLAGGAALPWLAGVIAQGTGIWTLLPFSIALGVLQLAVWRPLAARSRTGGARGC
ncbi:MAG: transporter [Actinomycetia bacterium]|nr:transporter [Actinomycetes bacterium]